MTNQTKHEVMWKGESLLSFKGDRDNYPEGGSFLARKILTNAQRRAMCWFPVRKLSKSRIRVPEAEEKCVLGNIENFLLSHIFSVFFWQATEVLEAEIKFNNLKIICWLNNSPLMFCFF